MSLCIILVGHHSRFIQIYMGKLRFTLTNIIFWIVLLLSCFLSENFAVLNNDPLKGFSIDSAFILTISIIVLLVLYYFLEHKKNNLTFDKVLLPALIISGLLLVFNVFRQASRTFPNYEGTDTFAISFSFQDRLMASFQVFIWLAVIYALVFAYNRFRLNKESYRWVGKIYLIIILLFCLIDLFLEGNQIVAIFNGTYGGGGFEFLMGNANIWSLLIFAGFLTAVLLSYKKFNWFYYIAMTYLLIHNLLTTCTTTTYLCIGVFFAYSLFEILSHYRQNKRFTLKYLIMFFATVVTTGLLFFVLVITKIPAFDNLWLFIEETLFNKNFLTVTGRTTIWTKVFDLLKANPLDFIFGLGHKTANKILVEYTTNIRTAHNAVMEVFLRYGLLGAIIYVGILGLTVFCLIRHVLKKNYRFAFIYGICFIAIFGHSMSESTTLFTPNVGGLYFSFLFVLPIINIMQEKRFNELKQDLLSVSVSKERIKPTTYINVFILLLISVVLAKFANQIFAIDLFSAILVGLTIFTFGLIIVSLIRKNKEYNPLKIISNNSLAYYQSLIRKENDNE